MPDRYFFTVPEEDIPLHFELMRALEDRALVCRTRHFPELEFSEFIVVTRDQPGLFSKIAGALTANNLNILSARITTRTQRHRDGRLPRLASDGRRLDGAGRRSLAARRARPRTRCHRRAGYRSAGRGGSITCRAPAANSYATYRPRLPSTIALPKQFTVIDVFTQDRVGLLFAITHTLFRLGLRIHLARISTNADQALDVFYVSDREGGKITDLDRMRELRAALLEKAEQNPRAGGTRVSAAGWDDLIDRHLSRQAVERGLSRHSMEAYAHDLGLSNRGAAIRGLEPRAARRRRP